MGHFFASARRTFTSWRRHITENLGLIVAIAAAAIALWSAKIQRDALQLDQRPYLKVTFESIKADKNPQNNSTVMDLYPSGWEGYDAYATLEVTGKTPAFNVDARGSCLPNHFQKGQAADNGVTDNGLTWRLWPFLFDEKHVLHCHVQQDLPRGNLPPNVRFDLTVHYEDIFKRHHTTNFCEVIITMRDEGVPRQDAESTIECDDAKINMD